jgi:hypothetical protein
MNTPNADDPRPPPAPGRERWQEHGGRRPEQGLHAGTSSAPHRPIEMDRLREVGRNLSGQFDEQVRKRPYAVVGAAAGIGFVAGSILGSRLGQMLLAVGIGYAAKRVLGGEFGIDRLQAGLEKLTSDAERRSGRS